jgi:pyruvate dehydrogenase E2 component (dihydrolipoamide acetyltransferase)
VEKAKASGGGAALGLGGLTAGAGTSFPPARARVQPHTTMRKVIAQRLTLSKQTIPHFYVTVDCEIDRLLDLRAELNALDESLKLSVNDFVIKATALALKQVPDANASWSDEGVMLYDSADISVAVAIPGGLITPIIKSAEKKGLAAISKEMKDLATRAKENKLKPEEFQGGTFSISNMGMFGVKDFSAIINPPQAGILAIAAGEKRPVVEDGKLEVATVMSVTLSCDHRVIDGALGAQYLQAFKGLIEHPIKLVL